MAIQPIPLLKETFSDNKEPNGQDFGNLIDSFEHKSIPIEQTRIRGLAQSFGEKADKTALTQTDLKVKELDQDKADKSVVDALANGIIKQDAVNTYSELATEYPNPQIGWDVLVLDENTRYNWNGTKWVDINTGVYDDNVVRKDEVKNELGNDPSVPIAQQIATQQFEKKADKTEIVTEETDDNEVCISDEQGHKVARWTKEGVFDTPKLSDNLIGQIKEDVDIATEYTEKEGVFIADEKGKAVASWTKKGVFDTPFLSENLLKQIAEYVGAGGQINPRFYADVYLIPCYGQSLSVNTGAGASTFSGVVPFSYDVNLNNTNVQDMCAGTAEMFEIMAARIGYSLPHNFKIMHCLGGTGGTSVAGLSKGSAQYNSVINSVRTAKATCDAAGLTFNVPCFTWTQGEEDMRAGGNPANYGNGNFDPFTYKNRLKQLIDDFNTDIKAITGQTNDVLCISYQVASHTSYNRYPRIAIQQAQLANEDSRFILAKTMYDVDYNDEGTFQVHAPARTYRNMGNFYGVAAWNACVMRKEHKSLQPVYHSINGNQVFIKFDVPSLPLVLDTELVKQLPDNKYGFNIYNVDEQNGAAGTITKATTTITSIELQGENGVLLTLSRAPIAGERLTYGVNGDYWQNLNGSMTVNSGGEGANGSAKSGRLYGARGCLRDSQAIINENQGAVFTKLYNWSVIFEIKF